jgi:nickel/cobalt exporter
VYALRSVPRFTTALFGRTPVGPGKATRCLLDGRLDLVLRQRRIDDHEPIGLGVRHRQEAVADTSMEVDIELGLEPGHLVTRLSAQTDLDREVEQDREIRNEATRRGLLHCPQVGEGHTGAVALVGDRRVGKAGRDDGRAAIERRADHLTDEARPGGVEQQGIRGRVEMTDRWIEKDPADLLAHRGTTGLAREHDLNAGCDETVAQAQRLAGLASAIGAFDRHQPSAWAARTFLAVHAGSVADGRHGSDAHPLTRLARTLDDMPGRVRFPALLRRGLILVAALALSLALPAAVLAHPLGNFTINTYSGLRVSATAIDLDIVLDEAEIPTFQERLRLDADGDGDLSDDEVARAQQPECRSLAETIELSVGGSTIRPELRATGLSFPAGAGGLLTMRLVCELRATLTSPISGPTPIAFANRIHSQRIGWREIVVEGDGISITADERTIPTSSVSKRLTSYPTELLTQPLSQLSVEFLAAPGGASLPAFLVPDAQLLPGVAPDPSTAPITAPLGGAQQPQAAIPGGVGAEIPAVFRTSDLSPAVILLALGTAIALGAGHALTPGHGKTLMAAYLVGTRGTAIHAAGLGLSVTVSHTLGILALAILVVGAQSALPPDVVVRYLPTIAALTIVAIGGWMLFSEIRRRRARAIPANHGHDHTHDHPHEHGHDDDHDHEPHDHEHEHNDHNQAEHSHGGVRHSHLPASGTTLTWRSLFLLGLAGGIIPSTNALLILLGTIATGRTAFGVVLVVAFGLGMAAVLGGVGLAMVYARARLERFSPSSTVGRLSTLAPLVASVAVLALGLWLTGQAVAGRPAL